MKTNPRLLPAIGLSAALALAACGGSGTTSAPAATVAPGATTASGTGPVPGATEPGDALGPGTTGAATAIDACALLPTTTIKEVSGFDAQPGVALPFGVYPSGCRWDIVEENAMVPPMAALGIMTTGGKTHYDQFVAPFNVQYGYEPIEGLGDEAVNAGGGAVLVLSGDTLLEVHFVRVKPNDAEIATALAKAVLANLGG